MHTIQSRPHTYFTGKTTDEKQALLGFLGDCIAVVVFDKMGNVLETRDYSLNINRKSGLGPVVEAIAEKQIHVIQQQMDLHEVPIQVKQFFVERWNIGLKQFPLDLEDYLDHPDTFSEEDSHIFRKDIEDWQKAGNCVLQWGNDYLLGRDGYTL